MAFFIFLQNKIDIRYHLCYSNTTNFNTLKRNALKQISKATSEDVRALSRIAVLYDIPTANNLATADFMLKSEFMNSTYERKVENFNKTIQDRVDKMK